MNKYVLLLDLQPRERAHALITTTAATQEKTRYQYRGPPSPFHSTVKGTSSP